MAAPAAFIFDMDGVLVDTIDLHYRAWKQVADAAGTPFTPDDMDRMRGHHRRDYLRYIVRERDLSPDEMQRYFAVKDAALNDDLNRISAADVLPGVLPLLDEARAAGIRLGVASSSTKAMIILRRTGLYERFDAVADGHTVARLKPAPDIFVWAAGALRTPLDGAVVFEDSAAGIDAAHTGGMFAVGLGSPDLVGAAELVLPDLSGATLDTIRAAFVAVR